MLGYVELFVRYVYIYVDFIFLYISGGSFSYDVLCYLSVARGCRAGWGK